MTTASEQTQRDDEKLLVDEFSSVQQRLVVLAEDTRTRMKRSARDIYHIGANLLEAQNLLAHGEFLGWIKVEFDMSKSSAYRLMDVARAFQDKLPILGNLEIAASALYFLASPNTPEPAREEVLELAAAGQVVSTSIAREIVGKHKKSAVLVDLVTEKGESLGLPTQGDSVLPESDYIDELRHSSPADVDDRLCAAPGAITIAAVEAPKLESHQLINSSNSNEWYTPKIFIDAAKGVMGGIDLDPASCDSANRTVGATEFFTAESDGYAKQWYGKVWLNPPYGRDAGENNQAKWSAKLISEYLGGRVSEAILLVNAFTGSNWFAPLWDYPICFVSKRIRFYNNETEANAPTHSNAIVYLGDNADKFIEAFSVFGTVAGRLSPASEKMPKGIQVGGKLSERDLAARIGGPMLVRNVKHGERHFARWSRAIDPDGYSWKCRRDGADNLWYIRIDG